MCFTAHGGGLGEKIYWLVFPGELPKPATCPGLYGQYFFLGRERPLVQREIVKQALGGLVVLKLHSISMMDVIATKFANEATADGTVAKLLQKLVPEHRSRFQSSSFVEIAKPNAEEQEWLAQKHAKWLESERDSLRELCPGKDWSNWQFGDPEPTAAEIAESRSRTRSN